MMQAAANAGARLWKSPRLTVSHALEMVVTHHRVPRGRAVNNVGLFAPAASAVSWRATGSEILMEWEKCLSSVIATYFLFAALLGGDFFACPLEWRGLVFGIRPPSACPTWSGEPHYAMGDPAPKQPVR
jgi:hypothetical protein